MLCGVAREEKYWRKKKKFILPQNSRFNIYITTLWRATRGLALAPL